MGMNQQRPGRRSDHVVWNYVKLQPGGTLKCHIVGPWVGAWCHWDNGSKPCRRKLTDNRLDCRYCRADFVSEWRAYVPLLGADKVRWVVAINEEKSKALDAIAEGDPVVVAKQRLHGSPLAVMSQEWARPLKIGKGGFPRAELVKWFQHMWKDAELAELLAEGNEAKLPNTVAELHTPDGPIAIDLGAAQTKADDVKAAAELLRSRIGDWRKLNPTPNGKHGKPKKAK